MKNKRNFLKKQIFILENLHKKNKEFYITIHGESMMPSLSDGQKIRIIPIKCYDKEIEEGDVILFSKFPSHMTVHRVYEVKKMCSETFYWTKGDNNTCPDNYYVKKKDIVGILPNLKK